MEVGNYIYHSGHAVHAEVSILGIRKTSPKLRINVYRFTWIIMVQNFNFRP